MEAEDLHLLNLEEYHTTTDFSDFSEKSFLLLIKWGKVQRFLKRKKETLKNPAQAKTSQKITHVPRNKKRELRGKKKGVGGWVRGYEKLERD